MHLRTQEPWSLPERPADDQPIGLKMFAICTVVLVALGFLFWFALSAHAQDVPPPDTSVNIGWIFAAAWKWIEYGVTAGVTLLVGVAASVYYRVMKRELDAAHRDALNAALKTGALNVLANVKEPLENLKIDVRNDLLRKIIEYARLAVPDALDYFLPPPDVLKAKANAALTEAAAQTGKASPAPLPIAA